MHDIITRLFAELNLGEIDQPIETVSGGFMHRMYKVHAIGDYNDGLRGRYYAVKHLNPEIMSRDTAIANFDRAEELEEIIEKAGVPIVPALVIDGKKRQCAEGQYFYVFNWQEGQITDWNNISCEQCLKAGNILGRIHALECGGNVICSENLVCTENPENRECHPNMDYEVSSIPWDEYIKEAQSTNNEIASILSQNEKLLYYAEAEMNKAGSYLPTLCCISDGDMDPKNVMWNNGEPAVIDLECLDYGNPVSHVLQLSLQWSGITTCNYDPDLTKAFFEGYLEACDNGFRKYKEIFGLAYTWVEWLEYNIRRALGNSVDEAERHMGIAEVQNTISRIRYIHDKEQVIKATLCWIDTGASDIKELSRR